VHGYDALSGVAGAPNEAAARLRRASFKSMVIGSVLQVLGALLVHFIPVFFTGNLYPVLATLTGAGTGFLYGRAARGASMARRLQGGALTAGTGGVFGTVLFALLGHLPFQLVPVAVITCSVAGALGAPLGRIRRAALS